MSRQKALDDYVTLCRVFNLSGLERDRMRAEAFLDGACAALEGGDMTRMYDFCVEADSAAIADGIDSACWGLSTRQNVCPELATRKQEPTT